VQAETITCLSSVLQAAAEAVLTGDQGVVTDLRRAMEGNRNAMMRELRTLPGVRCVPPDGTFYCLPDFSAYLEPFGGKSVELSQFLLRKAFVVTVPGKEFGLEGHLRLSYAGAEADVTTGLARLRWALDPDSPREIVAGGRTLVRDWR
jgi:aspartate aminotransferase